MLSKLKADLSESYEKVRVYDSDKSDLELNIRTAIKDVAEINEKLMKD